MMKNGALLDKFGVLHRLLPIEFHDYHQQRYTYQQPHRPTLVLYNANID